jgi:hypothetical protein
MSQGQPTTQRRRDIENATRLPFLPFPPFKEGPSEAAMPQFGPAHVPDQLQQHPIPSYAPFASFSTFFNPYYNMSSPPNATKTIARDDKTPSRTQFKSSHEYNPQRSTKTLWPNFSPGYSAPPVQSEKQSRLPSSSIGRKMPRKATFNSPHPESSANSSIARSKIVQRRASKKTYRLAHEAPPPAKRGRDHESSTPRPPRSNLPLPDIPRNNRQYQPRSSTRSRRRVMRRVIIDEDDEESEDNGWDVPRITIENCSTSKPTMAVNSSFAHIQKTPRPRPRFDYVIPRELQSVYQALGKKNWNDYMILMEQKLLGDIDEANFTAKTAPIFTMFGGPGRKRMERQIAKTVVMPVLDQHRQAEKEEQIVLNQG